MRASFIPLLLGTEALPLRASERRGPSSLNTRIAEHAPVKLMRWPLLL